MRHREDLDIPAVDDVELQPAPTDARVGGDHGPSLLSSSREPFDVGDELLAFAVDLEERLHDDAALLEGCRYLIAPDVAVEDEVDHGDGL